MIQQKNIFVTNIAVGVLGLFVGISNFLRWMDNTLNISSLALAMFCTICALAWLIYVLLRHKAKD